MYLGSGIAHWDPMMVWGTTVDVEFLDEFLAGQRRRTGRMLSAAHVLVRAVALSLSEHPKVNRRVTGRRVHQYDGVNMVVPMLKTRTGEVEPVFLRRVDKLSLSGIAERFWSEAHGKAVRAAVELQPAGHANRFRRVLAGLRRNVRLHWIHKMSWLGFYLGNRLRVPTIYPFQQELNGAGAFVNYLGHPGAPPLIAFKPSCLPMNAYSVNVTMGPSELRPVVVDGAIVVRRQAPLFVRADHRIINGHEAAAFINTLRAHLADPWTLGDQEETTACDAA
jgi:hypothetical protein